MATKYNPSIYCPQCGSPTKCATYDSRTRLEERTCRDHEHYFKRERPTRTEEPQRRRNWLAQSEQVRARFLQRQARKEQEAAKALAAQLPSLADAVARKAQQPPPEIFCPHCDSAESTEIETYGASGTDEPDIWRCDCGAHWELPQSERQ